MGSLNQVRRVKLGGLELYVWLSKIRRVAWEDKKLIWTNHARRKLNYYRLTESRIRRVIRHPARTEEGVLPGAVAAMAPAGGKRYSEIWVMYILVKSNVLAPKQSRYGADAGKMSKVKIITAWRYPGKAPERDPVPQKILQEIKNLL